MVMRSASGLGDIFNSLQGKMYKRPPASKSVPQVESHKRVILEKLKDQLITRRLEEERSRLEGFENDYDESHFALDSRNTSP